MMLTFLFHAYLSSQAWVVPDGPRSNITVAARPVMALPQSVSIVSLLDSNNFIVAHDSEDHEFSIYSTRTHSFIVSKRFRLPGNDYIFASRADRQGDVMKATIVGYYSRTYLELSPRSGNFKIDKYSIEYPPAIDYTLLEDIPVENAWQPQNPDVQDMLILTIHSPESSVGIRCLVTRNAGPELAWIENWRMDQRLADYGWAALTDDRKALILVETSRIGRRIGIVSENNYQEIIHDYIWSWLDCQYRESTLLLNGHFDDDYMVYVAYRIQGNRIVQPPIFRKFVWYKLGPQSNDNPTDPRYCLSEDGTIYEYQITKGKIRFKPATIVVEKN